MDDSDTPQGEAGQLLGTPHPEDPIEPTGNTTETPPAGDIRWSVLNKAELQSAYWDSIAVTLRHQGFDPETHRPTHSWLREHGYRPLLYSLREHHEMTFSVFWEDVLGMASVEDGYEWEIEHHDTIESFQSYLQSLRDRRELSDSSIQTLRYRLARYARAYNAVNETDDLLTPVARGSDIPPHEAVDTCWDAFDYLHQDLDGGGLKRRIHRAVDNWYAHLVRRKRASINPATGLENEFKWERDGTDNPSLEPGHVMALEETADSTEEHLLIIALCAWGLRPGEVAALHRSQIILNEDSIPYVDFEERKNGPGEVSILFGRTVYEERVIELSDRKQWNGYLFPSSGSSTGHITRQTVLNWFDDMADRAGLPEEIDGKKPVPKMGRRFWYDAYSSVLDNILQGMDEVASEQGSKSAEVVLQNYLSNERNRELRREQMRQRLSEAFGSSD